MGKQKRKNNNSADSNRLLTHDELWDDSALLDSWNEAVEEYKHYHSLHARGEKVTDTLDESDDPEEHRQQQESPENPVKTLNMAASSTNPSAQTVAEASSEPQIKDSAQNPSGMQKPSETHPSDTLSSAPPFPESMLAIGPAGGSHGDPAMKNLMMSWYWAGYYTGLHDGQKNQQS